MLAAQDVSVAYGKTTVLKAVSVAFRPGRMTALDMFAVQDGGPYGRSGDFLSAGDQASLMYTPGRE